MTQFHSFIAYMIFMFYLIARRESESTPVIVKSLLDSKIFEHGFLLISFIIAGIGSLFSVLQLTAKLNKEYSYNTPFDFENYKLSFYKPYLIPIAVICVIELLLWDWK